MKQQTAVEWLVNEIAEKYNFRFATYYGQEIQQAKEIEKERIETAYDKGTVHGIDYPDSLLPLTGEHYYKQTYGGKQ